MSVLIFILTVVVGIVILCAGFGLFDIAECMDGAMSALLNFLSRVVTVIAGGIVVIGVLVTFLAPFVAISEYNHTYKVIEVYDKEGVLKDSLSGEDLYLDSGNSRIHYTDVNGNDVYYYFDKGENVVKGVK